MKTKSRIFTAIVCVLLSIFVFVACDNTANQALNSEKWNQAIANTINALNSPQGNIDANIVATVGDQKDNDTVTADMRLKDNSIAIVAGDGSYMVESCMTVEGYEKTFIGTLSNQKTVAGDQYYEIQKEDIYFENDTKPEIGSDKYNQKVFQALVNLDRSPIYANVLDVLTGKFLAFELDSQSKLYTLKDELKQTFLEQIGSFLGMSQQDIDDVVSSTNVDTFGIKINDNLMIEQMVAKFESGVGLEQENYYNYDLTLNIQYNTVNDIQVPSGYIPFKKWS